MPKTRVIYLIRHLIQKIELLKKGNFWLPDVQHYYRVYTSFDIVFSRLTGKPERQSILAKTGLPTPNHARTVLTPENENFRKKIFLLPGALKSRLIKINKSEIHFSCGFLINRPRRRSGLDPTLFRLNQVILKAFFDI